MNMRKSIQMFTFAGPHRKMKTQGEGLVPISRLNKEDDCRKEIGADRGDSRMVGVILANLFL